MVPTLSPRKKKNEKSEKKHYQGQNKLYSCRTLRLILVQRRNAESVRKKRKKENNKVVVVEEEEEKNKKKTGKSQERTIEENGKKKWKRPPKGEKIGKYRGRTYPYEPLLSSYRLILRW